MHAMTFFWTILVSVLLANAPVTAAERVTVTGRAAIGTDGETAARRDALEDALFLAAVAGGADVRGFEMAENSIMVGDTVLLRPSSRVLDFEILYSGRTGSFFEVQIAAHVGSVPETFCARPRTVHVYTQPVEIIVSPNAPAWLAALMPAVSQRFLDELAATPYLRIMRGASPDASLRVSADFDYMSLVTGVMHEPSSVPDGAQLLQLSWYADAEHPGANHINVELQATLGGGDRPVTRMRFESQVRHRVETPARAITVLTGKSRDAVARLIGAEIREKFRSALLDKTCEPLIVRLDGPEQGGRFTVPVGRQDGLTAQSVGFAEGDDTPWTVFRVLELGEGKSIIAPINSQKLVDGLAGRTVRFVPEG